MANQEGGIAVAESEPTVANDAEVDVPVTEKQCVYCGQRFDSDILAEHQLLMHKGDMPTEPVALPPGASKLGPGSIIRAGQSETSAGIPFKIPWSKDILEHGWMCDNPSDRVTEEGGWCYIPEESAELPPLCLRCGGPMHKLSTRVEWDAPSDAPRSATWNGLTYWIAPGELNYLPDTIVGVIRASNIASRAAIIKPSSQVAPGEIGRLIAVGLLPSIEDDTD